MVSSNTRKLHILVVEDDSDTASDLTELLARSGHRGAVAENGAAALDYIQTHQPDLILLDLALPDVHGLALLNRLRAASMLPLIVVSGMDRDRVAALEAGADDFVGKPFNKSEMVARINALMRRIRSTPTSESTIAVGRIELNIPQRRASIRGRRVHLTPIEYNLLYTLMRSAGQCVTYKELIRAVWGDNYAGDYSVLRVNISRLRNKLDDSTRRGTSCIVTEAGVGYMLVPN